MDKSVIEYTDGRGVRVVKVIVRSNGQKFTGVAKCSPEDTYDFNVGRQIAEDRAEIKRLTAVVKFYDERAIAFYRRAIQFDLKSSKICRKINALNYKINTAG